MPCCIVSTNNMVLSPLIIIAGPTASGKSSIAIKLAKKINGVIINADSRQIYKELQIGTARPLPKDMERIPHYLYGHISVKDNYNIYKYQKDVFNILTKIPQEQVPILVGGTGLYIDSIVYNYKLEENNKNTLRKELTEMSLKDLQSKVPDSTLELLNNSDRNNKRRLIRIIEKGTNSMEKGEPFPHKYFVLDISTDILKQNVKNRAENMIKEGLIEENKILREAHLTNLPALNSIGYTEFNGYFEGDKNISQVQDEIYKNTLKYIKRQKTWFRRNPNVIWTNDFDLILEESKSLLKSA